MATKTKNQDTFTQAGAIYSVAKPCYKRIKWPVCLNKRK